MHWLDARALSSEIGPQAIMYKYYFLYSWQKSTFISPILTKISTGLSMVNYTIHTRMYLNRMNRLNDIMFSLTYKYIFITVKLFCMNSRYLKTNKSVKF